MENPRAVTTEKGKGQMGRAKNTFRPCLKSFKGGEYNTSPNIGSAFWTLFRRNGLLHTVNAKGVRRVSSRRSGRHHDAQRAHNDQNAQLHRPAPTRLLLLPTRGL